MPKKNIKVIKESPTGRNLWFYDPEKKKKMDRNKFVKKIKGGEYPGYYVRPINGITTPVSLPDNKEKNNLG